MATYASKLRDTAIDNSTIQFDSLGRIQAGGMMAPFSAGTKGGAPSVFYVDGNVVSSGNGLSWTSAFKTLTEGLVAAHAYMSTSGNRAWAHRATVYACGDTLTEDLVILAEKSDVIGVGTNSGFDKCGLTGNHVPVTTNCWAVRFYNFHFRATTAGIIWDLTAPSHGIKFFNCEFAGRSASHTHAIRAIVVQNVEIAYCRWFTSTGNFTTAAIEIGAGNAYGLYVHDNIIVGSLGVVINASTTAVGGALYIDNNIVNAAGLTIDDNSDLAIVTNNRCISAGAYAADTSHDFNLAKACNNVVTGNNDTKMVPIHST